MYFFYIDESGSRDVSVSGIKADGTIIDKDPLYVLLGICLHERQWTSFDGEIADAKLRLISKLHRNNGKNYVLADCEVKSTSLRCKKKPGEKGYCDFIQSLDESEKTSLANLFYSQLEKHHMRIFAVVVDKRCLLEYMTPELMHKKAYEFLLERFEHYMIESHASENALVIVDDTQRQLNSALAMKHAYFQREGNNNVSFKHIVEYPFFTDSSLSNGVQLADLCAYNVYRAFRNQDFSYEFFNRMLPFIYRSQNTPPDKLDGLKVWPENSTLIPFATQGYKTYLRDSVQPLGNVTKKPTE